MNGINEREEPDYYAILNIDETATAADIKKAYRKLTMIYHPDKNPGDPTATKKFQEISSAYEVLGDEQKRKNYDLSRDLHMPMFAEDEAGGIGNLFAHLFSSAKATARANDRQQNGNGRSENGKKGISKEKLVSVFEDFIAATTAAAAAASSNAGPSNGVGLDSERRHHHNHHMSASHDDVPPFYHVEKPTALNCTLNVSYDNMYSGALMPLEIERWIMEEGVKKYEVEILYVNVPKGIDENEIIILEDKGNVLHETCKGDVKVFIQLNNAEHPDFKRHGLDLVYEKKITVKEALCGFSFVIHHLNGTNYTINNTGRVISTGYIKKIPGLGIERDGHTGALVIIFQIQFPTNLDESVIKALKEIDF